MPSVQSSAKVKPKISVSSSVSFKAEATRLRAVLLRALDFLNKKAVSIDLSVIGDAPMRRINRTTRGKDEPTDVLSFENLGFPSGDDGVQHLGEIIIAPRSASRKGHTTEHLVVHGLLHLLGYTHESARDTIAMEAIEQRILEHVTRNHRT